MCSKRHSFTARGLTDAIGEADVGADRHAPKAAPELVHKGVAALVGAIKLLRQQPPANGREVVAVQGQEGGKAGVGSVQQGDAAQVGAGGNEICMPR